MDPSLVLVGQKWPNIKILENRHRYVVKLLHKMNLNFLKKGPCFYFLTYGPIQYPHRGSWWHAWFTCSIFFFGGVSLSEVWLVKCLPLACWILSFVAFCRRRRGFIGRNTPLNRFKIYLGVIWDIKGLFTPSWSWNIRELREATRMDS